MDRLNLPRHIVNGIERRWAARLEQQARVCNQDPAPRRPPLAVRTAVAPRPAATDVDQGEIPDLA